MKRTAIGRGRECEIRIKDSSDKISRKQCVITTSFTGKMRIYDTSANGTFLNGERVPIPEGLPLKKGDKINFAHIVDFDWSTWKNPYRKLKLLLTMVLVAIVVIAVLLVVFADEFTKKPVKETEPAVPSQEVVAADTVVSAKIVSPVTDPQPSAPEKKKVRRRPIKDIVTDPNVKPKKPVENPVEKPVPDPRLKGDGDGGSGNGAY